MPSISFPRSPVARRSVARRVLRLAAGLATAGLAAGALATGCLDRPVAPLTPQTTNVFVDSVEQQSVDKIDLLFMIDNSISMTDKQEVLQDAVPDLMRRLVNPVCVDSEGNQHRPPSNPNADCPAGQSREFSPISDIHVGVVTSSLGSSAADTCGDGNSPETEQDNDHGLMLGVRPRAAHLGLGASHGFLVWRPGQGTTDDIDQFNTIFRDLVIAAGERGCGFEESLEGWYRFLVEPHPPQAVGRAPCPNQPNTECAQPQGLNEDVLRQRQAFLRSDSLLAIIMLSDEDDCSTPITGQSYLALQNINLPKGTTVCGTNPNDPCCHSCGQSPPEGCQQDPACADPILPRDVDQLNQRCFAQKQRFGIDFKYPTDRYVNALSRSVLCNHPRVPDLDDRKCPSEEFLFRNPIYADLTNQGGMIRTAERVFIAAIVGVPWQNLQAATDPEGNPFPPDHLRYKTYDQMVRDGTWDDILGDPKASPPIPPNEPLMIESLQPRGGNTRSTGEALQGPGAGYMANSINGHEWGNTQLDDLQYACIFPLPTPRECAEVDYRTVGCDCHPEIIQPGDNNPLCQRPDGSYGTEQRYAKAYPGPRFLQVAKDYGDRSIVASICARNLNNPEAQDFGYRPAIAAIVDRLKEALSGSCLPRQLAIDPDLDGDVPCFVVEAALDSNLCSLPGREPANASPEGSQLIDPIRGRLEDRGVCGGPDQPSCDSYTLCTVKPAQPHDLCLNSDADNPEGITSPGWCYVDPEQGRGNPAIVADCKATERRLLRFVGDNTPAQGARIFVACIGADLGDGPPAAAAPTGEQQEQPAEELPVEEPPAEEPPAEEPPAEEPPAEEPPAEEPPAEEPPAEE